MKPECWERSRRWLELEFQRPHSEWRRSDPVTLSCLAGWWQTSAVLIYATHTHTHTHSCICRGWLNYITNRGSAHHQRDGSGRRLPSQLHSISTHAPSHPQKGNGVYTRWLQKSVWSTSAAFMHTQHIHEYGDVNVAPCLKTMQYKLAHQAETEHFTQMHHTQTAASWGNFEAAHFEVAFNVY